MEFTNALTVLPFNLSARKSVISHSVQKNDNNLIIKIILFQEDINIFGTSASLTYVYRACCERFSQPFTLAEGGTICQGSRPTGYYTLSEMVTECLLIRSMLIKMHVHGIYTVIYIQGLL